jgi:hypothetical protein
MLERSLREMFASQVRATPALEEPASAAIRRGRRQRRWHLFTGGLTVAVLLTAMSGAMLPLRDWWRPPATSGVISPILPPTAAPEDLVAWDGGELGLELRVANRLWTAQGERVLLSGAVTVTRVHRTPYGLVYGGADRVRLLREDRTELDLGRAVDGWLVSPDGRRLATVTGSVLRLAPLGEVGEAVQAEVPPGRSPVAFWGDRVVLAGPAGFDLFDPDTPYGALPDPVVAVYGEAGPHLVVLVGEPGGYCLAVLRAGADAPPPACARPVPVTAHDHGWLSPDGRWLAVPARDQVNLFPVPLAGGDSTGPATCPSRAMVTPSWWDATTLLTADNLGAVRCDVHGVTQRLRLPVEVGLTWQYVPPVGGR